MSRMERVVVLSLGLVAACNAGDPVDARHELEPVRTADGAAALDGDLASATLEYVRSNDQLTSLDDDWRVRSIGDGIGGRSKHVRLDQLHAGVRVWGADIVVHIANARVQSTGGNLVRGLAGIDVLPTLEASQALAIGQADYVSREVKDAAAPLAYSRESTELVILPRPGLPARLTWRAVFYTELQAGAMPGLWNTFVDAATGEILYRLNAINTLSQASGPGGNPNVSRTWNAALDVEPLGGQYQMSTAKLRTVDLNNGSPQTGGGTVVTGPLSPIGDAAINDAHGFAEVTLNVMSDWFGYNSLDDAGFIIRSRVHYGNNFANASWNGQEMTYGDGDNQQIYALSGDLAVVAHELNHGFTEFHSSLIYDGQPGGLNESFSDVAGATATFFMSGNAGTFDIGADLFVNPGNAVRYMCDPTQDGVSIDHFSDYAGQDVHFTSGIPNKAFCRAARRLASGSPSGAATAVSVRRAAQAWYEANDNQWTQSTTFQQACEGVLDAATALGFTTTEKDYLRDSWADVGVLCDGAIEPIVCDETLTTASGTIQSPNYPNQYPNNVQHTWCIKPAGGAATTLVFDAFDTEQCPDQPCDFVTIKNGNTGAVFSNVSGTTLPPQATSSYIAVTFSSDASVTATGWHAHWGEAQGTPDAGTPDDPDAATGTPDAATDTPDAAPGDTDAATDTPDAGPGDTDADLGPGASPDAGGTVSGDGGCCSTGANPAGALPLIALVGGLLFWPRRRRRAA